MILPVRNVSIRENMLVTMGLYAGELDAAHQIGIPSGAPSEDELAEFVAACVDEYLEPGNRIDEPFDLYAETRLLEKYGR